MSKTGWSVVVALWLALLPFLFILSLSAPGHLGLPTLNDFVYRNRDDINAYSTIVIAIFTAILGMFTVSLARSTRVAAEAAEKALVDLERPWLFIENAIIIHIVTPATLEVAWTVRLIVRNIGRAPALIDTIAYRVDPRATLPVVRQALNGATDLSIQFTLRPDVAAETDNTPPFPEASINHPVFHGVIRYHSVTGQNHESWFALDIDVNHATFTPFGGSNYNSFS
jgi:hypothetical protein